MINLSLEWESVDIKSIAEVIMGQSPQSKYYNEDLEGMPFLQGNKTFGDKYPTFELYTTSIKKIAEKGTVLMSVRAPVGDLNIATEDICIGRGVCSLKMKKGNNEFLYYLIKANISSLINRESGTVFGSVNKNDIESFEVKIPKDIETQDQILTILKNIDEKIRVCKQINHNLEEELSLIFDDWFVKCTPFAKESLIKTDWGYIPKSWKNIDFGDLIEITSGDRPKEKSEHKTTDFNIPLFGASKIMGYTKDFSYNENILIIGRVGTHGIVQRVYYPCFPSDNTFVIKSNYYGFVYQILKRIDYDSLNTGSTQPLITQKSLKTVNCVFPDEDILKKFEDLSKTIFEEIYLNEKEINNLVKIRDTLLPKLMSGEIDVSKVNYDFFKIYLTKTIFII